MNSSKPDLDSYWGLMAAALPELSREEQRTAVALYRELAQGKAVESSQLAAALGTSASEAEAMLARPSIANLTYPDEQGRVLGFGGLATAPTQHRLEIGGRQLWTWCAWDSLFIPQILGATARVTSVDPETGQEISLVVTPGGVDAVSPESTVVSFLLLDEQAFRESAAKTMSSFCHFVFFFASPESGQRWSATHSGTFLYSVHEAFQLGRRFNHQNFGLELTGDGGP